MAEDLGRRSPTTPTVQRTPHTAREWIAELNDRGPVAVGAAFGLAHDERGAGSLSPCPACGASTRHPKRGDKRGAVGLRHDGAGWRCFECDASGDAVKLAALLVAGKVPAKGDPAWRDVRQACAERGLCDPAPGSSGPAPVIRLPPPPPKAPPVPPKRLPAEEVAALWSACALPTRDSEVAAWLRGRALDPAELEARELVKALPVGVPLPSWARFKGRPWSDTSHRVIVRLLEADGSLASLHARALAPEAPGDKAASPSGAEVRGLVMADAAAELMLAGTHRPARVIVAEGVPDFLTWAVRSAPLDPEAPAVLGVIAGSWNEDLAARVPRGATVYVRTHADGAGEGYADQIAGTLARRCRVFRRPKAGKGTA